VHLSPGDFRKISPHFGDDFLQSLSVEGAISSKSVPGGTAETSVLAAIAQLEQNLAQQEKQS
jgi:argininosuccinate lyase